MVSHALLALERKDYDELTSAIQQYIASEYGNNKDVIEDESIHANVNPIHNIGRPFPSILDIQTRMYGGSMFKVSYDEYGLLHSIVGLYSNGYRNTPLHDLMTKLLFAGFGPDATVEIALGQRESQYFLPETTA